MSRLPYHGSKITVAREIQPKGSDMVSDAATVTPAMGGTHVPMMGKWIGNL
jgi:hypothetical protein